MDFAYYFHDWLLTLEIPFHHSIYQSRKMSGSEPFARIEYRKNIGSYSTILVSVFQVFELTFLGKNAKRTQQTPIIVWA